MSRKGVYCVYVCAHGAFFSRKYRILLVLSLFIIFYKNMSLVNYIRDTKAELKHVSWPTRKQAIAFTILTVIISIVVAFYLGFFDFVFSLILEQIIT